MCYLEIIIIVFRPTPSALEKADRLRPSSPSVRIEPVRQRRAQWTLQDRALEAGRTDARFACHDSIAAQSAPSGPRFNFSSSSSLVRSFAYPERMSSLLVMAAAWLLCFFASPISFLHDPTKLTPLPPPCFWHPLSNARPRVPPRLPRLRGRA